MSNLFLFSLIVHLLGDFYLQSEKLANDKITKIAKLSVHILIYSITAFILFCLAFSMKVIIFLLLFIFLHLLVDFVKFSLDNTILKPIKSNHGVAGWVFITDQLLHIIIIFLLCSFYQSRFPITSFLDYNRILRIVLVFLLILKPVNIAFRKVFSHIKPKMDKDAAESEFNTGQLIGNMERILIVIFLLLGQFTAIGLVFTAKSITRYNKIAEDKEFAEYYLLGTLFSIIATLIIFYSVTAL